MKHGFRQLAGEGVLLAWVERSEEGHPGRQTVEGSVTELESRPCLEQVASAAGFHILVEGHFARHIRQMRTLYGERQAILIEAAKAQLEGLLAVSPSEAGLHLVGWLPEGVDDRVATQHLLAHEVEAPALSAYGLETLPQPGLVLGYAALRPGEIRRGVRQMAAGLAEVVKKRGG